MEVALQEAHAGLHLQLAEHGKSASDIEAAMKEAHTALKLEFNLHKKEFEVTKDGFETHKSAFDQHRSEFNNHMQRSAQGMDEIHGGIHGKLGQVEARLQAAMEDLHGKHRAHASTMSELEKQLREDLKKVDGNHHERHEARSRELNDVESKLKRAMDELNDKHEAHSQSVKAQFDDHHGRHTERHSELTDMYTETNKALEQGLDNVLQSTHQKLAEDLRALQSGVEGSHGNLKEVLAEVTKEVDALTFSLQAEKGLRTQMEEKLRDNITEIRRELEDVFNEAHAALRLELANQSKDSGEIKAALQDAHEALRSEMLENRGKLDTQSNDYLDRHEDMRARVQSELSILKSGFDTSHNSFRDRLAELTGQIDGLAASLHAEQTLRSDAEERLEQRTTALEHKMRREIQENLDESSAKQREVTRELRDSIHNFNNENHARHLKLQSMIDGHIQGVIQSADQKLKRALDDLKEGIDTHNVALRDHLGQERTAREAEQQKLHTKMNDLNRALKEDNEALRTKLVGHGTADRGLGGFSEGPAGWEEEAKRLWEAIDTHTHDVAVEDVEEERQVRTQFIRQEVPSFSVNVPASVPTAIMPATPLPTSMTRVRSPASKVEARYVTESVDSMAPRVIPATPLPVLSSTLSGTGLRSLSNERKIKCGNCPNLLGQEENFCRKCGWEKPIHGPPLVGTNKILHNVATN